MLAGPLKPLLLVALFVACAHAQTQCATNNGNCPAGGSCIQQPTNYTCVYIPMGSFFCPARQRDISAPDGSSLGVVLGSSVGDNQLDFTIYTGPGPFNLSTLSVYVGSVTNPTMFGPTELVLLPITATNPDLNGGPKIPNPRPVTTTLGGGSGDLLFLFLTTNNGATVIARSNQTISYPVAPVVYSVSGCTDVGNSTTNCPTAGGVILSVTGEYLYGPVHVLVNGVTCGFPTSQEPTGRYLTCMLPPGVGADREVVVVNPLSSNPVILSYGKPTFTAIVGCSARFNTSLAIADCDRHGGDTVTLLGTNFGDGGALILVAGALALNPVHNAASPHTGVTFTMPPGTGADRTLVLLQSGGQIGTIPSGVSYALCPAGYVANGTNCAKCGGTSVSGAAGAESCTTCGPGTRPNANLTDCVECEAGSSSPGNQPTCTLCAPGSSQRAVGQTGCIQCPVGKFASAVGSTECTDCPVNTIAPQSGSHACTRCTGVLYQPLVGQSVCQSCGSGQYYNGAGCQLCPVDGTLCSSSGISAVDEYYVYLDQQLELQAKKCLPGYCLSCGVDSTAFVSGNGTSDPAAAGYNLTAGQVFTCCANNRIPAASNPLCGSCLPGHFLSADECVLCESTNVGLIVLFIVVEWLFVIGFHRVAQQQSPDMRIFVNFVQMVFLFLSTQASGFTSWLSLFNFNVWQVAGKECVAPLTDLQRLGTGLFIPLMGFTLLAINMLVHYCVWVGLKSGRLASECCSDEHPNPNSCAKEFMVLRAIAHFQPIFDTYRRTFIALALTSYPSLVQSVFTFFSCGTFNDDQYMTAYPSVSCLHDTAYLQLRPLFILLIILMIGLPIGLYARLYQLNRAGLLFGDPAVRFIYGALTEGYAPSKVNWECFVLVRRLVVAAIALDVENDRLPAKFTFLCMLNICFLGVHFQFKPFVKMRDNYSEALSLVTLTVLTLFLIDAPKPLPYGWAVGLTTLCFVVAGMLALRIVFSRYDTTLAGYFRSSKSVAVVGKSLEPAASPPAGAGAVASVADPVAP